MDPSDYEDLRQELSEGPLRGRSFQPALQKKILKAASQSARPQRQNRFPFAWAGGALAMVAVFAIILFSGHMGTPAELLQKTGSSDSANQAAMDSSTESNFEEPLLQTAVLIGLRTDHPATEASHAYSDYRTILVAPEDGKIVEASQGEGILMPYNQDFWMIEPVVEKNLGKEVQILSAGPARRPDAGPLAGKDEEDTAEAETADQSGSEPVIVSEKLLFAGNRDVAIEQEAMTEDSSDPMRLHWVKHIDQLSGNRSAGTQPLLETHVPLGEIFPGTAEATAETELEDPEAPSNWTIVRKPGRWTAQQVEYNSDHTAYEMRDLLQPLPREVVSHDKLSVAWEEIWQREPEALDAYSSPNKDLVAIVKEEGIVFYLNSTRLGNQPALSLDFQSGESIVMVQWAAAEGSPERWKKLTRDYLNP
ncbi:hypothetical protein [Paenibacillus sp. 1P07SE]|uniref:hypothetical protein n=1 Tax=Paenibacillus sp. 1P07SE TaxID=3132209 RepID=UPI0039A4CF9A